MNELMVRINMFLSVHVCVYFRLDKVTSDLEGARKRVENLYPLHLHVHLIFPAYKLIRFFFQVIMFNENNASDYVLLLFEFKHTYHYNLNQY